VGHTARVVIAFKSGGITSRRRLQPSEGLRGAPRGGGPRQIERKGTDVTIVTFSRMVGVCLEVARMLEKDGISVEVINLR
jgi:deoxyxylulose-5-phosphate synthase